MTPGEQSRQCPDSVWPNTKCVYAGMHSSEVTGTVQSTPFSTFFRLRLSLSRAVLRRTEHARRAASAASWRRLSPTPTLGAKTKSRRSDRICNHLKERTRSTQPEHQAGKASTRLERRAPCWKGQHNMLWACLPPRRRHGSPLVCDPRPIAAPYCCAQPPLPGLMHTSSVMSLFSTKYLGPRFVITEYTSPLGS